MKAEKPLAFQLKSLNNRIRRLLERSSIVQNDANLTGMQYAVLGFLTDQRERGEVYQRDVEEEFNIRRSTASQMIRSLEEAGFIRRESVPGDARLKSILLTQKAEDMARIATRNIQRLEERLTTGISEEEMAQFYRILQKIHQNAGE